MSHVRWTLSPLALALALALAPARPAVARPLPVESLAALAEDVEGDLLLRLAERRGLSRPLEAEDRAALLEAGLAADAVDRLMLLSRPAVEVDGIAYDVLDGVLRVRAVGDDEPTSEALAHQERGTGWPEPSFDSAAQPGPEGWPELEQPSEEPSEPLAQQEEPLGWSNPYPTGAYGATAGAVYVPARYGGRPSSFGRTIVMSAPLVANPWWGTAPVPVAIDVAPQGPPRRDGFIPFRTSRGTLWVPN